MAKYDFVITLRNVDLKDEDPTGVAEDVLNQVAVEGLFDDVTIEVYESEPYLDPLLDLTDYE